MKKRGGLYSLCTDARPGRQLANGRFEEPQDERQFASLLDKTLIVCLGESDERRRTERCAGRDHWPNVRSGLFAGGGVRHGGRILGATDEAAAQITRFDWAHKRPSTEDVRPPSTPSLNDWNKKITGMPSGRDFNTSSRLRHRIHRQQRDL